MNAVAGDRDLGALCCPEAEPLILAWPDYLNRCAVLGGFVCDSTTFGIDLFPSPFLEHNLEERKNLHCGPFRVASVSLPSSPVSHQGESWVVGMVGARMEG